MPMHSAHKRSLTVQIVFQIQRSSHFFFFFFLSFAFIYPRLTGNGTDRLESAELRRRAHNDYRLVSVNETLEARLFDVTSRSVCRQHGLYVATVRARSMAARHNVTRERYDLKAVKEHSHGRQFRRTSRQTRSRKPPDQFS